MLIKILNIVITKPALRISTTVQILGYKHFFCKAFQNQNFMATWKIIGKNKFPYHFKKIIVRYKKIGDKIDVFRQTACLVVNPIKVNSFAYHFNCTTVGRASD